LLMTRPRLVSTLEYLRPLTGRESWDHFDVRDLGLTIVPLRKLATRALRRAGSYARERLLAWRLIKRHEHLRRAEGFAARSMRRLLFLCHGNICRSPVAAQIAREALADFHIESAGFFDQTGRCSPTNVIAVARSMGIDVSQWRSRRVTADQIAHADLILVMDLKNYRSLASEFPEAVARTTLLGLFGPERSVNIRNPDGRSEAETRRILQQISSAVHSLAGWLKEVHAAREGRRTRGVGAADRISPALDSAEGGS